MTSVQLRSRLSVWLCCLLFCCGGVAASAQTGGCTWTPCQPPVTVGPNSTLQTDAAGNLFFGSPPGGGSLPGPAVQCVSMAVAGGSPDAITVPKLPCVPTTTLLTVTLKSSNATATPTIQAAGDIPRVVLRFDGTAIHVGDLIGGARQQFVSNGTNWFLMTLAQPVGSTAIALSPMSYGCVGNGTVDDTACVQAAINDAASKGLPLQFDSVHLYSISATLNIASPVKLVGPFRYGIWHVDSQTGSGPEQCPWGLVTRSNITLINASAITGTISGLCLDMALQTGNPSSGAAIKVAPPNISDYSSGWQIELNTILYPFDGITLPGNGPGAGCCGRGTSADGNAILRNTIINPLDHAIEIGKNSAATSGGPGTVGNTVWDNNIVCKTTASQTSGVGIAVYEGGINYDGTENGPEGCNIGTLIAPGSLSGTGQQVIFQGDGVLGDFSRTHDLMVQPQAGGNVIFLEFSGKNPWASGSGSTNPVLIDCATFNASCQEISLINFTAHGGSGQNVPVIDIEGGTNGPYDVTISSSDICNQGGATASGSVGIKLGINGASTQRWVIANNRIGTGCGGSASNTGIQMAIGSGNPGNVTITGNDLSNPPTPIAYTPNAGGADKVVIANNAGLDTAQQTVTAATSITLPGAYPTYSVSGSTVITTINGAWAGRRVVLLSNSNNMNLGAGGNVCNAISNATLAFLVWQPGATCWSVK